MPNLWPDKLVVRVHAHSERVLGLSPDWVMGRGVMSYEEKAHDRTRTRTQDLSQTEYPDHLAKHVTSAIGTRQGSGTPSQGILPSLPLW